MDAIGTLNAFVGFRREAASARTLLVVLVASVSFLTERDAFFMRLTRPRISPAIHLLAMRADMFPSAACLDKFCGWWCWLGITLFPSAKHSRMLHERQIPEKQRMFARSRFVLEMQNIRDRERLIGAVWL